ncbi:MAG: hypothetical protein ACK5MD_10545, partial [Flavobacteriales bacterium]
MLLQCDNREITSENIQWAFPFEFEVTYPDTIQFNAKAPIQLFIGNDHQVDGQTFDITYRTKMEGEMYYEDKKVSMHNMPKGWDEVSYKPLEAGTYNIEFTASNGD